MFVRFHKKRSSLPAHGGGPPMVADKGVTLEIGYKCYLGSETLNTAVALGHIERLTSWAGSHINTVRSWPGFIFLGSNPVLPFCFE
jgi:hypothetical protein